MVKKNVPELSAKSNNRLLIQLYEQHPCLYAVKSTDYHNGAKKEKALEVIRARFLEITGYDLSASDIKAKINSLRTLYLRNLSKIRESKKNGSTEVFVPTWWLFNDMNFLEPYVSTRERGSSSVQSTSNRIALNDIPTELESSDEDNLDYLDVCRVMNDPSALRNNNNSQNIIEPLNCSSASEGTSTSSPELAESTPSKKTTRKRKREEESSSESQFWRKAIKMLNTWDTSKPQQPSTSGNNAIKSWLAYLGDCIGDNKQLFRRIRSVVEPILDEEDQNN